MAYVQDITISISSGTGSLTERSFDPLIVGAPDAVGKAITNISDLTDLITAGYTTTDEEYLMASAMLAQTPRPSLVRVMRSSTGYAADLATLREIDDSWYSVCIESRALVDLQAVGTWAESNSKMFFGACTDVTSLSGRSGDREAYIIHSDLTSANVQDYPECAWVGRCLSKDPWGINWKWKELTGQQATTFTKTQLNAIRAANGCSLQEQAGSNPYTNYGQTTSGENIATIIGKDWVENQLNIGLIGLFLRNDNIPMDDSGIAQVESVVRDVLRRAGDEGIIARCYGIEANLDLSDDKVYMYTVTVPLRSELSINDRAAGNLTGVEFVYYTAGAINTVTVTGKITV
jgi:hypothetical protein